MDGNYGPSPLDEKVQEFYQWLISVDKARQEAIRNKIEKKAKRIKRLRKKK